MDTRDSDSAIEHFCLCFIRTNVIFESGQGAAVTCHRDIDLYVCVQCW
jgi:hypothetical protein